MTDAYEYDGRLFHPRCVIEAMIARGDLAPAARDLATGEVFEQFAHANAVGPADGGAPWVPARRTVHADAGDGDEAGCRGCERPLVHDASVPLRPDPIEQAVGTRPTSREVADLLTDYRQMIADADGWAHRIPADRIAAWEARKRDVLGRIQHHQPTAEHDGRSRDAEQRRGWSL